MTALVTKHLPLVSGAPDGFKAMRGLIQELALRGKLTPQDKRDEPATALLRRIAEEQAELIANGVIRQPKQPPELSSDSVEFDLPTSWRWASVASLVLQITDGTHHTPTYLPSGVPFISVKDIDGKTINFNGCKYISKEQHKDINARCNPEAGDILLCRIGTLGRPTIVDTAQPFSLFVSVGLLKLPKKSVIARFLHLALSSPLLCRQYEVIKAGGSHTNKLNLGDIPRLCVPVPPLAEQQRIVAKVDELMALCDRLEADQADAEAAHAQLVQALLHSLTQATDAADFRASWQRLSEHFHTLFTTEASVDELKQTVLQLAVMGKLVQRYKTGEPTSTLRRQSTVSEAKAKDGEDSSAVRAHTRAIQLPQSWEWRHIADVVSIKHGYAFSSSHFLESVGPYVLTTPGNFFECGGFKDRGGRTKYFDGPVSEEFVLKPGDLVVAMTEQAAGLLGSAAFIPNDGRTYLHNQRLGKLSFDQSLLAPKYLFHFFNCSYLRACVAGSSTGMKVKHTSPEKIGRVLFPLPPLAEQHRIVAKVDELMALCDQLKAQLQQARQQHAQLASVLVEQAVSA
jgi:type I restriction enzyme S subunit